MDIDTISGAGGTVVLGNRLLTLRQLKMGDIGKWRAWVKERLPNPMKIAAEQLKELQPIREFDEEGYKLTRDEILLYARQQAKLDPMEAYSKEAEALMESLEGISYLLWLSIRAEHVDITYEKVEEYLNDEDLGAIKTKLDKINAEWMRGVVPDTKKNGQVVVPIPA